MVLVIYRVGKRPKLVLEQIRDDGWDEPVVFGVDGKNRDAVDAAGKCFVALGKPEIKTSGSPMTAAALARALARSTETIAIVIGEAGVVTLARELAIPTPFELGAGEAAVLELDASDWTTGLARSNAWEWLHTLVEDP